mgnify:CR=1 FL=1
MSDARLRELERRFLASRDPQDEATWLVERVRVGRLRPERLELAGLCGHTAARTALLALRGPAADPVAAGVIPPPDDLGRLLLALDARDPAACARAALTLARAVAAVDRPLCGQDGAPDPAQAADLAVETALRAAEALLRAPSPLAGALAARAARALTRRSEPRAWAALRAATAAARLVDAPRLAGEWNERVGEDAAELAAAAWMAGLDQAATLGRVRAEVAAWAIGAEAA